MSLSSDNNRWGPTINEYIEILRNYVPPQKPSRERIDESYQIFYQPELASSVTCPVLEDVLLLPHYPDKILQLGSAWRDQMIEPVMRLLEMYTQTNRVSTSIRYIWLMCKPVNG